MGRLVVAGPGKSGLPLVAFVATLAVSVCGCGRTGTVKRPVPAVPPPTYTGPAFLRGTVGSLTHARYNESLLVGGVGVVLLPPGSGTGSPEVPDLLRQRLINDMRKRGLGSSRLAAQLRIPNVTPEQFLASHDTAVVAVEGFIPPGATPGTRFDVLVGAVDSQTTSLAGGTLFTVDMGFGGASVKMPDTRTLATARGPIYISPVEDRHEQEDRSGHYRQAVVIGGGKVTIGRNTELVLNQASWVRSRDIANRINERFGRTTDRVPIAKPLTDLLIKISVPHRFDGRAQLLLDLIEHLYVRRGPRFEPGKAEQLAQVLQHNPRLAFDVVMAWRALGRAIIPVLQRYYEHAPHHLKLAALEAGAALKDERASRYLEPAATDPDPWVRARVAAALVYLPRSLRGQRTLKTLLDDEDRAVRIAAYESAAAISVAWLDTQRVVIPDEIGVKFVIDRVPAEKPLIYVTQQQFPRLVVFGPQLGFEASMFVRLWDNHLMLRTPSTIDEALVGVEAGGTATIPVEGRGQIEADGDQWVTDVYNLKRRPLRLRIRTGELRQAVEAILKTDADTPVMLTVRLIDRAQEPVELELIDVVDQNLPLPVAVYYQPPNEIEAKTLKVAPTVASLAYMLGHKPTVEDPQEGLDLSFSQVVGALHQLCAQGFIAAPFEVASNPLADLIREYESSDPGRQRPETSPETRPETSGTAVSDRGAPQS